MYFLCFLMKAQAIWHCFHPRALPLFYLKTPAYWSWGWKPWSTGTGLLHLKICVYVFCFLLKAQAIWHCFHPGALALGFTWRLQHIGPVAGNPGPPVQLCRAGPCCCRGSAGIAPTSCLLQQQEYMKWIAANFYLKEPCWKLQNTFKIQREIPTKSTIE